MNVKDIGKNIELLNIIGKGSYGNVYLGINNLNNQYYAIKVISKSQLQSRIVYQYFNNEIYILKHINHPNIVKYISLVEQKKDYWLVIEYCNGGSLVKALKYHLTKFNKPIPEEIVRYIVKNILTAVIYLNNKNIIHRDIKSDNILLHYENEEDLLSNNFIKAKIKLIDFGFARYLDENELAGSLVGTPMYMDPNVLKTFLESKSRVVQGFYDQKVDVWSLGILTYELLIGIVPFMSKDIKGLFQNVNKRDFYIPKEEKRNFYLTEAAIKFIDKTLNIDPNVRPLPAELINDPWFSNEDTTIFQMKTDDEIKLLNNKKLFINFWKPKVSKGFNKISMKEKFNLKRREISLNLDKEKKKKIFMNIHKNKHLFNFGNNTTNNIQFNKNEEDSIYKNENKIKNDELNKNQSYNYYKKNSDNNEDEMYNDNYNDDYIESQKEKHSVKHKEKHNHKYDDKYEDNYDDKYNHKYNHKYIDKYNNKYDGKHNNKHNNKYRDKYSDNNNDKYDDNYNDNYNDKYDDNYNDKYNNKYNDEYNNKYDGKYEENYDDNYNNKYNDEYEEKYYNKSKDNSKDKYNNKNKNKYNDEYNDKYSQKYIDKYSEKYKDKYTEKFKEKYNEKYSEHHHHKHKKNDDSTDTLSSNRMYKYTKKKPKKIMKNMELVLTNINDDNRMRFNTESTKTTKNKKTSKLKFMKDESSRNPEKNSFSNTYSDFNLGDKTDTAKHNIIKIKSINYISNNDNQNPNTFSQNDSYKQYKLYKYASPIKNLFNNSSNFVHKTWTNNFLYKKKNSFSNSMRKINQYPKISKDNIEYDDESDDDDNE